MAASLCECCEKHRQVTQGLCYACILDGLRKVREDDDPNLGRYLELVGRTSGLPKFEVMRRAA